MRNNVAAALSAVSLGYMLFLSAPGGEAATPRGSSRDLATHDSRLTMEAGLVTKDRLSDKYDITLGQVDGLLNRNIEHGELAAILTVARKMRGGVKVSDINKVIDLRQSGVEWDQIAEKLHLDLSASGAPSGRSRRLPSTSRPPGTAYSRRLILHGREEALSTPGGSRGMPRRGIARSPGKFENGTYLENKEALAEFGVAGAAGGGTDANGR